MKDNDLALNSQKLDALRDELMKEGEEGGVIRSMDLAKLTSDMQQFMEVSLCVSVYVCVERERERDLCIFFLFLLSSQPKHACNAPSYSPSDIHDIHIHVYTHTHTHTHTHTQDEFGVTAKQQGREWLMTRIPAKLFRDYSPRGALFTVCVYVCVCMCTCVICGCGCTTIH